MITHVVYLSDISVIYNYCMHAYNMTDHGTNGKICLYRTFATYLVNLQRLFIFPISMSIGNPVGYDSKLLNPKTMPKMTKCVVGKVPDNRQTDGRAFFRMRGLYSKRKSMV